MKFSSSSILFAVIAASTHVHAIVQNDGLGTTVTVEAKCTGVDFDKASVTDIAFAGRVLQDTFNEVHIDATNNDDKELSDIHYSSRVASAYDGLGRYRWGGWSGDVHCRLCTNDDMMVSATSLATVSGTANKAWEHAFAAGLEASQLKIFANVGTCQIEMKISPDYVENPNVDISVKCKGGPDFNNLSVADATLVSHALQASYNTVHSDIDDGDSSLDDVFFHAGTSYGLNNEEAIGKYRYKWGGWSGDASCRLCTNDDDAATKMIGGNGAALKAWENELVVALLQSTNDDFHAITSCDIKMLPHKVDEAQQAYAFASSPTLTAPIVDDDASTHVKIIVKCLGLNFKSLGIADDNFIGNLLQDTYNDVHDAEGDDSILRNIVYDGLASSNFSDGINVMDANTLKRYRWGGWSGDASCRLCKNDDDASIVTTTKQSLKVWENQLTAGLLESGRPNLQNVKSCIIKMRPFANVSDEKDISTKCGLRACADE